MKKKVYIVYSSDDHTNVKRYFIDVLERECDVKCIYDLQDFIFGKTTVDNIAEAIKECHKTFVILTPSSMEKNWVKYEMLLALEKSQHSRRLCVMLFLFQVARELVQGQLFGVLSDAMMVMVNVNKDEWQARLKQAMLDKLQVLGDRIRNSEWYRHGRFPDVEFNLIPDSAKTVRKLDTLDSRIKYHGSLEKIIAGRGSFGDRPYNIPVYSICDNDGTKFYFVAQIPNTLSILSKLEHLEHDKDSTSTGRPCLQLTSGERSLQVARFTFIYNRLVNHPKSRDCNNKVVLLPYNDSKVKAGDILLKAIKKQLGSTQVPNDDMVVASSMEMTKCRKDREASDCEGTFSDCDTEYTRTVYIDCLGSCDDDIRTVSELDKFLKNNGFHVWNSPIGTHFQILAEAMKKCKWAIFVISKSSIQDKDFPLLHFKFRELISKSVEENQVRVIPIADGIDEDEISHDLRAVTYLSKQESDYKDKLLQILNCGNIPMECKVTAQDVSQGLAWAYVLNYLNVTLKDRTSHFDLIQKNNPHCKVYRKMFIIIPSSCASKSLGALDKDERGRLIDPNFEQLQDIHYNTQDVSGNVDRQYQLVTYKITTPNRSYIVAVEYPNAVLCLQEMSDLEPLSGLSKHHLSDEAWRFKDLVQQIIDSQINDQSSVADRAKLLYYDDSNWTVAEAMLEVLQQEKE